MMTFLAPAVMMALGLLHVGEQAGGFNHQFHAQRLPRQFGGRLGADHLDILAIDDNHVVFGLVGGGFLGADRAFEAALDGIIFEQIRQVVRRHDIADRDHFDFLAHQSLFDERAEDQATDAPEPVDCYFHCHNFFVF